MFVQIFKSKWNDLSGPTAILRPNLMLMDEPPLCFIHHQYVACCQVFTYSIHSAYMTMYRYFELCSEILKRPRYTSWLSFRLCWFSFDWSPWTAIRQWKHDEIYPDNNYTWSRCIDTDIIQTLVVILKRVNLINHWCHLQKHTQKPDERKILFPKADPQVCLGVSWSNQSRVPPRIVPWVNDLWFLM